MTAVDSFKTRRTLKVGTRRYDYYSLKAAEKNGLCDLSRLPFSLKVLLENLLRHEDGRFVKPADIQALAKWDVKSTAQREISFAPMGHAYLSGAPGTQPRSARRRPSLGGT